MSGGCSKQANQWWNNFCYCDLCCAEGNTFMYGPAYRKIMIILCKIAPVGTPKRPSQHTRLTCLDLQHLINI